MRRKMARYMLAAIVVMTPAIMLARGQAADRSRAAREMQYEGATVKPNTTGCCTSSRATTDQAMLTNETLKNLVVLAYGVQPDQVTGPEWITKARLDITGKFPPGTKYADRWLMLQRLLKERFKLVTHSGTKEMSGYSLQVAKSGFKLQGSGGREASTVGVTRGCIHFRRAKDSDVDAEL